MTLVLLVVLAVQWGSDSALPLIKNSCPTAGSFAGDTAAPEGAQHLGSCLLQAAAGRAGQEHMAMGAQPVAGRAVCSAACISIILNKNWHRQERI